MKYKGFSLKIFDIFNIFIMIFVIIITLYPFAHVASVAMSNLHEVSTNQVTFYPKGIDLDAYKFVLKDPRIGTGYKNTVLYTVVGTAAQLVCTALAAYVLSKKRLPGRNIFLMAAAFTIIFNGGMIPTYLVVRNTGLIDKIWAMFIPRLIAPWYLIIMKTFFESIPESLSESAYLDGATELQTFTKVVVPLSVPIFCTIGLFYAVEHWNSFFNALIYLNSRDKFTLQMVLRNIVIAGEMASSELSENTSNVDKIALMTKNIKAATIMVATIPIMCVYPFIQKYFVKGMTVGAIKG